MNEIFIKRAGYPHEGCDPMVFRAYSAGRGKDQPLGISASTTGNKEFGVLRCAAKAFIKYTEPKADPNEIKTRIALKNLVAGVWTATLQPKISARPTTADILNGPRRAGRPVLVTSAEDNPGD
jgi:hypothetical protein